MVHSVSSCVIGSVGVSAHANDVRMAMGFAAGHATGEAALNL
jgi:hypothetical protein